MYAYGIYVYALRVIFGRPETEKEAHAAESLIRRLIDGSLSKSRRETERHCRVCGIAPGRLRTYIVRGDGVRLYTRDTWAVQGDGAAEERRDRVGEDGRARGGGWKGYEGAAGSAALIKLAEDNEPVCRLACLAV